MHVRENLRTSTPTYVPGQEKVLACPGRRQARCIVGPLARLALARDGVALKSRQRAALKTSSLELLDFVLPDDVQTHLSPLLFLATCLSPCRQLTCCLYDSCTASTLQQLLSF